MTPPGGAGGQRDGDASLLAGLEPAQRSAVLADDPVVCVLAGAGTGKTRVLTLRVARRVEGGAAHPAHVLVCTFSRKAADELRTRLWRLGVGDGLQAGTFHRTALRIIARHHADQGRPAPVLANRRSLLVAALEQGAGGKNVALRPHQRRSATAATDGRRNLARLEAEIGWAKARLVAPAGYEEAARGAGRRPGIGAGRVASLYELYETTRRRRGVLDLDDLLWHCADLLENDPAFATTVRWWHRHVFVDEAQDMNDAQYRLLRLLVGDEPDLFVVGDPNQSVYGWNGADPALLRRITEEFAGVRVVRLDANHRCSPQVVAAAAAVLGEGQGGAGGPVSTRGDGPVPTVARLATDAEEATWVARRVWMARRPGRRWSSIAVLARTNAQLERIADALRAERVPCRVAGAEVSPASDVGSGEAEGREPSAGAAVGAEPHAPGTGDREVDDREIDDREIDDREIDDVQRPVALATADGAMGNERVVLSTFHRAKGLQWAAVFVVGLSDGLVPLVTARSRAARDEERRLLYVALTRAEDELTCSWALHPDEVAQVRGEAPRLPSPWLAGVQDAIEALRAEAAPNPSGAAEHLARIRHLLPAGTGGDPEGQR
jgi:DNA helicase II / ATP-dependent DNA helicase PcrA